MGKIESIHIAPQGGGAMQSVTRVRAIAGAGLEGDRYASGRGHWSQDPGTGRNLTLIEAEVIDALRTDFGIVLDPGAARRNLTTRGIRLNELVGVRFRIGRVVCQGMRLCEPCQYLTDLVGRPILDPLVHRAGLRADILSDGYIRVGDQVAMIPHGGR